MDLPSGLKTHDTGGQGADVTYNFDMELLDERLENVILATTILGVETLAENAGTATDPATATATEPTISSVSGTGDDTAINTNFTNVDTAISALIADNASIRARLIETIDYCDALKVTVNDLRTKLRNMGVLGT